MTTKKIEHRNFWYFGVSLHPYKSWTYFRIKFAIFVIFDCKYFEMVTSLDEWKIAWCILRLTAPCTNHDLFVLEVFQLQPVLLPTYNKLSFIWNFIPFFLCFDLLISKFPFKVLNGIVLITYCSRNYHTLAICLHKGR